MPVNLNGMDPRVLSALRKIQADAAARGIQTNLISGVRTYQDQVELAANAEADRAGQPLPYPARGHVPLAAAPGSSLHERGLAFDLQAADPSRQAELESLAPGYGLRTLGAKDPNHFELASAGFTPPARPGTPQTALPSNPIYEGLVARGYSPVQAYALMGNMQQESQFSTGALNQKEGAYGLIQWREGRREDLINFAQSQGKPVNDLNTQLDFIRYEQTKGKEAGNSAAFLASTDVGSANAALKRYIRYGDNSEGARLANAQAYASGKTATPGASGSSLAPGGDGTSVAPEPPPEFDDLGSMMSDAVTAGPSRAATSNLPTYLPPPEQFDTSYALADPPQTDFSARYLQGKQTRKLSPLSQIFSVPTIGQPTPQQPLAKPFDLGVG